MRYAILLLTVALNGCALDQPLVRPSAGGTPPSESTIALGLKEALRVGTERAVASTSRPGGFTDTALRIALPEQLDGAVDTLRAIGLGGLIDSFETAMNRAAETAAGEAAPVFISAIQQMSLSDVYGIFRGGPTAATDYFRAKTSTTLQARFAPIIDRSLSQVGVYRLYKDFITPYQQLPFTENITLDLSDYVTDRTLAGLFTVLGEEEAKIRANPLARSTELLRQVFGS